MSGPEPRFRARARNGRTESTAARQESLDEGRSFMFTRIVKNVVIVGAGGGATGPDEYRCGYEYPEVYTLDAGNQPGPQVLDVRWEYPPFQPLPQYIWPPSVDVVDDT